MSGRLSRGLARLAAASGLVLSSSLVGAPSAVAADGACTSATKGVTVVVDFDRLGGGTQQVCVPDGGGSTAALVTRMAGFELTSVDNKEDFVCRIDGKPGDQNCVETPPGNAFWGFFYSKGTSRWTFSSSGAYWTKMKDGWSVGWRFQDGGEPDNPRVGPRPTTSAPSPKPTPSSPKPSRPTKSPRPSGTPQPTAPAPSSAAPSAGAPAADESSVPRRSKRNRTASPDPSASYSAMGEPSGPSGPTATSGPTDLTEPTDSADVAEGSFATVDDATPSGGDGAGLATVAGLGGLSLLAGSAAVVAWRRRT